MPLSALKSIFSVIMNTLKCYQLLQKMTPEMGGVFSTNDLRNLFNQSNDVLLSRMLKILEKEKILKRFRQGFYTTTQYNAEMLTCRIYPDAYISLGTVLSQQLVIGSIPSKTIYAVRSGRNKLFQGSGVSISYFGIAPSLMFDISLKDGIRYVTAEKAFLDCLYFYQKGRKFSFNIFSDVNFSRLNLIRITQLLEKYNNPKFIAFVNGVLSDVD